MHENPWGAETISVQLVPSADTNSSARLPDCVGPIALCFCLISVTSCLTITSRGPHGAAIACGIIVADASQANTGDKREAAPRSECRSHHTVSVLAPDRRVRRPNEEPQGAGFRRNKG